MTRFAWLQSRTQTLVALVLLAAVVALTAVTGVQLSHLYHSLVANCHASCELARNHFLSRDTFIDHTLDILGRAVPALLGIFWGAPLLAREFETGTYRLAWTQSVSRSRWLVTKLLLGGLATAAVAGSVTLAITWWYRARDKVGANQYGVFDRRDIVPIGYAVFAFAVGVLIGAIIRRTVPAMAASLGVFVFVRVAIAVWIRPHLLSPVHQTMSLANADESSRVQLGIGIDGNGGPLRLFASGDGPPNSWTLSSQLLTRSGHSASSAQVTAFLHQQCPNVRIVPPPGVGKGSAGPAGDAARACLDQAAQRFHLLVSYQPAGRYWTFQWLETAIFLALALAAAAGCFWWVTRRSS
jgi:ABC-type transport system involved in multi-copper enzyme maturation permease subunit